MSKSNGSLMEGFILVFGTGFGIGLLGSLHCIGMCGPLALALPVGSQKGLARALDILAYNLGRALTYAGIGVLVGLIGHQLTLWGWQQALSIGAGLLMIASLAGQRLSWGRLPGLGKWHGRIAHALVSNLKRARGPGAMLGIGLLNGLLPCGLVYVGLLAAIAMGTTARSATLMFAFGLGTLPALAGMMAAGSLMGPSVRQRFHRMVPLAVILIATLLILRGMNLGVPYLSPRILPSGQPEMCHQPPG